MVYGQIREKYWLGSQVPRIGVGPISFARKRSSVTAASSESQFRRVHVLLPAQFESPKGPIELIERERERERKRERETGEMK